MCTTKIVLPSLGKFVCLCLFVQPVPGPHIYINPKPLTSSLIFMENVKEIMHISITVNALFNTPHP